MSTRGPGGEIALVYSGEAYNYLELREELCRRGHSFLTDSDTEVVLRGYLEWGLDVASRLNGMYAFAIWDAAAHELHLVRDRLGVKPLYYYPTEDGLLFGSEPKAILANPLTEPVMGVDGLRELFVYVKTPRCGIWEGMREVEPGTVVTVGRNGLRERRYWSLRTMPHRDDLPTTIANVRDLLDDIVQRQLVADVPRCALLSGGLDSSVITALAAAQLRANGDNIRSFAVDFRGQEGKFVPDDFRPTPDAPYVKDMARHVGTEHHDIVLESVALATTDVRAATVFARDLPAALDDVDASIYLLFKAIREHSTVALSGESADEVFGGYRWFHDPDVQRAEMFPWLAALARFTNGSTGMFTPEVEAALNLPEFLGDSWHTAASEVERGDAEDDFEYRMRRMSYLHLTRFLRGLLDRKDRMSMAVGLEVRVPFCDHRLVEYVYNVPWAMKVFDGREKSLLRAAAKDLLPQSVLERVKTPYPSTQDPEYGATLLREAREVLANRTHQVFDIINRGWLEAVIAAESARITQGGRYAISRVVDLAIWFDGYLPRLKIS